MIKSFFVENRRLEKQHLLEFLKAHKEMTVEKSLALYSLSSGLRVARLEIYFNELKQTGLLDE